MSGLPMTREQIAEEMGKCVPWVNIIPSLALAAEHILRIGTIAMREESERLRSGEFICKRCGLRKDADNFFKDGVPF